MLARVAGRALCKTGPSVRGFPRITRRAMMARLAAITAFAQTEDDPFRQLRAGHPRMILLDSDLDLLRGALREVPQAKRLYAEFEKECDRLLSIPPVEYKLAGNRLSSQTRRALDRVTTLAAMYRISGRDPWFRRAVMELNAAASFKDWNPAHFIDVAEMTHAFAIGYDWLYPALTPEERGWMRDALVSKGLEAGLAAYQAQSQWTRDRSYWNVVCNAALAMGALAVADEAKAEATQVFRFAMQSLPRGLANYTPDGAWPEGLYFWEYATRYACLLFSTLETTLGSDSGLSSTHGIDRTGRFRIYLTGPTNKIFNFGDSPEELGAAPEMFWMARRYGVPAYAWSEAKEVDRNPHDDAYDLVWLDRDVRPPQTPAWPLDAVFHSLNIAAFRGAWDDPNATFLAVRGGDNKIPHTHLDLGNFVLDAGGIRWATDLGPDEPIPPAMPGRPRVSTSRSVTDLHNTITIDGANQDARAEGHIVRQEFGPDLSWVQLDLTRAYPKLRQWTRKMGLAHRQAVLMEDNLRADQPVEAIWGMMTDADVSIAGQTATLHKAGWNLAVEIASPRHALFDLAPARPGASQNPGMRRLVVRLSDKVTELDLAISMVPFRDGQPKPKVNVQFPS